MLQIQLPPHEAEVMGVWEALPWIKSSVHSLVLLEMDAQGVVQDLTNPTLAFSPCAMLVAICQVLLFENKAIPYRLDVRFAPSLPPIKGGSPSIVNHTSPLQLRLFVVLPNCFGYLLFASIS